jgi:hypothetical protein
MSTPWLHLALVLWDSLGYLNFWDYVTNFLVLLLACLSLSCGAFVSCHLLQGFLFSAIFCFTIIGRSSLEFCSFLSGVACHAAFWIAFYMFSTASISVFRGITKFISSLRVSLKQFQLVFLLYKDGFFDFPGMWVNIVIKIGVWSDVRSRHDSTVNLLASVHLVTQKSTRSGILLGSLGQ